MKAMGTTVPRTLLVCAAIACATLGTSARQQPATPAPAPVQPAQPSAPPDQQPVFRAGIDTVRVDVIVTDRQGNPVTDLKLEDFQIEEDGKPQKADTFRLVRVDTTTQPGDTQRSIRSRNDEDTAAADERRRIFMVFLDDYHVMRDRGMVLKKPVIDFIANQLGPSDLLGVMHPLTPIDGAVVTGNHQGVINAVEKFEGRRYNYEPVNATEAGYVYRLTPDAIEMIRRQVTFTAIRGICTKMGALREGRKSLILLSEGYNSMLPPQMRSSLPGAVAGVSGVGGGGANRDPFAADGNINEDRARFGQDIDMMRELQDVWDACNRGNVSIYPVDPRGLAAGAFDITSNISIRTSQQYLTQSQDTLRDLAGNTDGRAIVNRNDLAAGMRQIVRDSSAYYLVVYTTQAATDGKFHEIRVRVKRPGVQVRHRKGFWAFTNEDVKRAMAPPRAGPAAEITKALTAIAPMTNRRYIRTWFGTDQGPDGGNRVTFLWEPLPPTPGVRRDEARRVTVLATSPSGDIVYRGRVPSELASPGNGGIIRFNAPPGKLGVRLTIEGDGTGALDTEDRDVTLPDLTAPELRLSTPQVWFARNAREFQALTAGTPPAPAATRDFRRTDRLLVRVDAYSPANAPAQVTVQLLNQQGTKMADIPVTAPAEGQTYSIDLPLASLAPGQDPIEITANSEGHKPVTELVALRLGS